MTATILPLRPGDPQWLLLLWEREKGDAARRKNGKACLEIMKDQARVRFEDSKGGGVD